jgi:hypothetical protein
MVLSSSPLKGGLVFGRMVYKGILFYDKSKKMEFHEN